MERGLAPNKLVPKFRAQIDDYRFLLPIIQVVFSCIGEGHPRAPALKPSKTKLISACLTKRPGSSFLCTQQQALRNRAFKERHWTKVFDVVGTIFDRGSGFTLQVRERRTKNNRVQDWLRSPIRVWGLFWRVFARIGRSSAVPDIHMLAYAARMRCSSLMSLCAELGTCCSQTLMDANVVQHKDAILAISTEATQVSVF